MAQNKIENPMRDFSSLQPIRKRRLVCRRSPLCEVQQSWGGIIQGFIEPSLNDENVAPKHQTSNVEMQPSARKQLPLKRKHPSSKSSFPHEVNEKNPFVVPKEILNHSLRGTSSKLHFMHCYPRQPFVRKQLSLKRKHPSSEPLFSREDNEKNPFVVPKEILNHSLRGTRSKLHFTHCYPKQHSVKRASATDMSFIDSFRKENKTKFALKSVTNLNFPISVKNCRMLLDTPFRPYRKKPNTLPNTNRDILLNSTFSSKSMNPNSSFSKPKHTRQFEIQKFSDLDSEVRSVSADKNESNIASNSFKNGDLHSHKSHFVRSNDVSKSNTIFPSKNLSNCNGFARSALIGAKQSDSKLLLSYKLCDNEIATISNFDELKQSYIQSKATEVRNRISHRNALKFVSNSFGDFDGNRTMEVSYSEAKQLSGKFLTGFETGRNEAAFTISDSDESKQYVQSKSTGVRNQISRIPQSHRNALKFIPSSFEDLNYDSNLCDTVNTFRESDSNCAHGDNYETFSIRDSNNSNQSPDRAEPITVSHQISCCVTNSQNNLVNLVPQNDVDAKDLSNNVPTLCNSDKSSTCGQLKSFDFMPGIFNAEKLVSIAVPCANRLESQSESTNVNGLNLPSSFVPSMRNLEANELVSAGTHKTDHSFNSFSSSFKHSIQETSHKGSNWLQSLGGVSEQTVLEEGEKQLKKITRGGLAERLLKLQRRQKAARTIWAHERRKHDSKKSLVMAVLSIWHWNDFVALKCYSKPSEALHEVSEMEKHSEQDRVCLVLLKKQAFDNLHLKGKDRFRLFQPWKILHLHSFPHPVILCAHFIDSDASMLPTFEDMIDINIIEEAMNDDRRAEESVQQVHQTSIWDDDYLFFSKYGRTTSFTARVQRIWEFNRCLPKLPLLSTLLVLNRCSTLLQTEDGFFHVLVLNPDKLQLKEGQCYFFPLVSPSHRLDNLKDPELFKILESIAINQENQNHKRNKYCFQFMIDLSSKKPYEVEESRLPTYCPVVAKPLALLQEVSVQGRFSGVAWMALQFGGVYYLWDDSLPPGDKSVKLQYLDEPRNSNVSLRSLVFVKEAIFDGEYLVVDKYSKFVTISNLFSITEELNSSSYVCSDITGFDLQKIVAPLQTESRDTEIVSVEGTIISVDESKAYTWLQCSFCSSENLIQDTNNVIYCEDCCQTVPNPTLNINMIAVLKCGSLQATVQLLSNTVKKVCRITDNERNLDCRVADVLGQKIGPMMCVIHSVAAQDSLKMFVLTEIEISQ